MRKLYEIGDQPLPITSIRGDLESDFGEITYYFNVPLRAPEGSYAEEIPMKVIFIRNTASPRELGSKMDEFLKVDSFLLSLIKKGYDLWMKVRHEPGPDLFYSKALLLKTCEVLFKAEDGDWDMANFRDHTLPIKIMATVKYCVADFIEKNPSLDLISFLANKEDRGRSLLYDRFSKLIAKSLGFSIIQAGREGSHYQEFICVNSKKLRDISLRLERIKEILEARAKIANKDDTIIQDILDIDAFIKDIAEGNVKITDTPKQPELFDDL